MLLTSQAGEIAGAEALQGMSLVVKADQLESDREKYASAVRAEVRAMKDLNDDPDAAGVLLRKTRFSTLDDSVWDSTWSRLGPSLRSPLVSSASLGAWVTNGLIDAGEVTSDDVDVDAVIEMALTEKAMTSASWTVAQS